MLRIKFSFSLWNIYSHAKYIFSDYIASITCFKNFFFDFFETYHVFLLNLVSCFRFFSSHFLARFVISSQSSSIWFSRRFDLIDVEKIKSFWVCCETNYWLYIWFERNICDENEIASKKEIRSKKLRKSSHRELEIWDRKSNKRKRNWLSRILQIVKCILRIVKV